MSELFHTFYFDGVDCESLGLHYAPEINGNQTYVWNPAASKVLEQQFESHDGGYYYGHAVQPKEFNLRCYYEQTPQEEGLMYKVFRFFRKGRRGKLSFQRRPWVYYDVVITGVDIGTMYNFQNGLVVIKCKAYNPYGLLYFTDPHQQIIGMFNSYEDPWDSMVCENNSEIWKNNVVPYPNNKSERVAGNYAYVYVYNPGEVSTPIRFLYRDKNIIQIKNTWNQSTIDMNVIDSSVPNSNFMCVDGETGKCYYGTIDVDGNMTSTPTPGFKYHKRGFLYAEPCEYVHDLPKITNISIAPYGMLIKIDRPFTQEEINTIPADKPWCCMCKVTATDVRVLPIMRIANDDENDGNGIIYGAGLDPGFEIDKKIRIATVNPILVTYNNTAPTDPQIRVVLNPRFN